MNSGNIIMKLKRFFSGDLFRKDGPLYRNRRFLLFVSVLFLIYITNDIILGLEVKKNRILKEELLKIKTKHFLKSEELIKIKRYPEVVKQVKKRIPDLQSAETPPKKVKQ